MTMTEDQFLKTMIETIKYDDYEKKEEMLTILRNSVIYFDKTSSFATRSWQCWENIDLRVPIPLLKEARNLQKNLQDIASMVYIETDDYDFNQLNIKPKPIDLDIDNYKEHNAFFQRLKTPLYKESAMQNI